MTWTAPDEDSDLDQACPESGAPGAGRGGSAATTALELMKQLITLSAGVLALSATFIENFRWSAWWHLAILVLSWACLGGAVLMGLETISAIVKAQLEPEEYDWSSGRGLLTARLCKYGFVAGLLLFALFAFVVLLASGGGGDARP